MNPHKTQKLHLPVVTAVNAGGGVPDDAEDWAIVEYRDVDMPSGCDMSASYFVTVVEQCGFDKHLTLYSLRHTMATGLLMAGVNAKIVSERLGHSSVALTLDTYSHVLPHIQDEATAAMERMMRRG